ncbi:MAG: DUF2341 domain-containing protein, partial [Burkholderiales bacterium]|nr:DUF2341 domain-containing protein [Burkholderiales bacterium]
MTRRARRPSPPRMIVEALEARILHSADAQALLDPLVAGAAADVRLLDAPAPPPPAPVAQPAETQAPRSEIVFVDARVPDAAALAADLARQRDDGRRIDVVALDADRDGIAQITAALAERRDIAAIHLISHGADGRVALGATTLERDTLLAAATRIKAWGEALSDDADLLIYGCNVAASADGRSLMDALARLTGADVAASDDPTGSAAQGGDWDLEFAAGAIEAALAPSADARAQWQGLLDITSGLRAHWTFDANANDLGGSVYNGTLTNGAAISTSTATNKIGAGKLSLDGSNDYVDLGAHDAAFASLTTGTLAAWIRTSATSGVIVEVSDIADSVSAAALWVHTNGKLAFTVYENGVGQLDVLSTVSVNDGNWHHVAVTVDSGGNKLYIDGALASVTYNIGSASTNRFFDDVTGVDVMHIGRDQNNAGGRYYFNGLIDDVRVYDRALALADIGQLATPASVSTSSSGAVQTLPGTQSASEDGSLTLSVLNGNAITVDDGTALTSAPLQVSLSTTGGTLALASTAGLSIVAGANGTGDMVLAGTEAAINTALDGLVFTPPADTSGATSLSVTTALGASMQGFYQFESAGTPGSDTSAGTLQTGSVLGNAAVVADGTRGNVLALDGTGDAIQIGSTFGAPSSVTIGGWVNLSALASGRSEFISIDDRMHIALDDNFGVKGAIMTGAGTWSDLHSNLFVAGTGWRHVMYVFDDASDRHALYIDGTLVAAQTITDSIYYTGAATTYIGRHTAVTPGWDLEGRVDDVSIYDRALSAAEVLALAADDGQVAGSVAITIAPVNDAPAAAADAYTVNEDGTLSRDWWNAAWSRRSTITMSGNTFSGATSLADFPVLITLNSSNIDYSLTQNGGQDLRFFDADGTALAHQVDTWNEAGDSLVWVRVPVIDTTGTDTVTMYYGNAAAADGQSAAGVWNSGFRAVYHMGAAGATVADATAQAIDATAFNGATTGAGRIGSDQDLDGVDDHVSLGTNLNLFNGAGAATLSLWVNPDNVTGSSGLISTSIHNGGVATSTSRLALERNGANVQLLVRADDSTLMTVVTTTNPLAVGTWKHVAASLDLNTQTVSIYVDGTAQATTTTGSLAGTSFPATSTASAAIGSQDNGSGSFFDGQLDEARIANVSQTAAWTKADYLSMTNAFVTVGPAASAPTGAGVLANDSDIDSVLLSALLVSGPTHASSFTLHADGTFTYVPAADYNGTDSFTYKANDGTLDSAHATVTISVTAVNDTPTGADKTVTTAEDTAYTFSASDFGFGDVDAGDSLSAVRIDTLPGAGSLTLSGVAVIGPQVISAANLGNLVYTPAANANGAGYASFTFSVRDQSSAFDTASNTITFNVTAVNDTPTGA